MSFLLENERNREREDVNIHLFFQYFWVPNITFYHSKLQLLGLM